MHTATETDSAGDFQFAFAGVDFIEKELRHGKSAEATASDEDILREELA